MATVPQPAKKSYFFDKGYKDMANTIKGAWSRNGDSIKKYGEHLKDLGDKSLVPKIFLGIVNVLAAIAVVICGSLITAAITLINVLILIVFMAIVYIGFTVIWIVDRLYLTRKKIFTACHECKEKSLIPTYICPKCGAKHTNLIWGKRKSVNGRWIPHNGDLNTFFSGDKEQKKLFLDSLVCTYDDEIPRYFVPEVNSANDDLVSIVNDLRGAGVIFI